MRSIILSLAFISLASVRLAQPKYTVVEPPSHEKGRVAGLAFTSPDHGVVILDQSVDSINVYLTRDAGTSWTPVSSTGNWLSYQVMFVDSLLGFMHGRGDNPYTSDYSQVTTDGGETWSDLAFRFADFSAPDRSFVYAVPDWLGLYRSDDKGHSWVRIELPPTIDEESFYTDGFHVAFRDSLHGFVTGLEGGGCGHRIHHMYYTSDGGMSWSQPLGDRVSDSYVYEKPAYLGKGMWAIGRELFSEITKDMKGYLRQKDVIQNAQDRGWAVTYDTARWPSSRSDTLFEISAGGAKIEELIRIQNLASLNAFNDRVGAVLTRKDLKHDSMAQILVTTTGWRGTASVKKADRFLELRLERSNVYVLATLDRHEPLILFDVTGRQMSLPPTDDARIDLTPYPTGVYFLHAGNRMFKVMRVSDQ